MWPHVKGTVHRHVFETSAASLTWKLAPHHVMQPAALQAACTKVATWEAAAPQFTGVPCGESCRRHASLGTEGGTQTQAATICRQAVHSYTFRKPRIVTFHFWHNLLIHSSFTGQSWAGLHQGVLHHHCTPVLQSSIHHQQLLQI